MFNFNNEKIEKIKSPEQDFDIFTKKVDIISRENHEKKFEDLDTTEQEKVVKEALSTHQKENVANVEYSKLTKKAEEVILNLVPDEDNDKIKNLIFLTQKVGIFNTLEAIEKTESAHISDDFHKFLVQYLNAGYPIKNLNNDSEIYKGLNMILYSIKLPEKGAEKEEQKDMQTLLASMEQFYSGMISASVVLNKATRRHFTIEIAMEEDSDQVVFYCAVPTDNKNIFKNNILSIFPNAQITEEINDYNIFNKKENISMSLADYEKSNAFPIKTYEKLSYDPLNIILQAFSNLKKGEGAAIQLLVYPSGDEINKKISKASAMISNGDNITASLKTITEGKAIKAIKNVIDFFSSPKEKKEIKDSEQRGIISEELKNKNSSQIFNTNIRLVAVGNNKAHSEAILHEIEASFHQFTSTTGNAFKFYHLDGKQLKEGIRKYIFRIFNKKRAKYLNIKELTTLVHFPKQTLDVKGILSSSTMPSSSIGSAVEAYSKETRLDIAEAEKNEKKLQISNSETNLETNSEKNENKKNENSSEENLENDILNKKTLPRIPEFDNETLVPDRILLGFNEHQGTKTKVYMKAIDRMRHMYVIGQTGTGKTTILKNMIIQDIKKGEGVCFIDPHGSDIEDIIANIPPERYEDLVYFDPAATKRPFGLNMLEYDPEKPEQKSFVVDELMSIFGKLFDMKSSGGPMFEMYFRQAVLLVIDEPNSGATLMEVTRVFADEKFRAEKIAKCKSVVVKEFWEKIANKAGGDASLENVTPYITSKFDNFLANDYMRPIIAQEKTTLDFKDIMNNKKILIVNLSKGRLGELNSSLIGMIVVGKILLTALGRVDLEKEDRAPFYLYMDEFQNISTDSISQILSEARKYALSLNVAHQFIKQLDEGIKDAIFGNVGTIATYRVGSEDAEFLEKVYKPTFNAKEITDLPNYNSFLRPLIDGSPVLPFNLTAYPDPPGDRTIVKDLMNLSFVKYGRRREVVEWEINKKFKNLR